MSWGVSVPAAPTDQFLDTLAAAELSDTSNKPELVAQWREQLALAKQAAATLFTGLMASGQHSDGIAQANLSGHANHGDAGDGTGYMRDEFIHVSVNWRPTPPTS